MCSANATPFKLDPLLTYCPTHGELLSVWTAKIMRPVPLFPWFRAQFKRVLNQSNIIYI